MRLSPEEVVAIKACALRVFGTDVKVYLFGSRADDTRRGGDIDLLLLTTTPEPNHTTQEQAMRDDLERLLGERKIDIVVHKQGCTMSPIADVAYNTGIRLL